jgi:hypothetical protein
MEKIDAFKLIAERQTALADEINNLSHRISLLKAELDDLDHAATVLKRLAETQDTFETAFNRNVSVLFHRAAENLEKATFQTGPEAVPSGKPAGLPPMTEMINEALDYAHSAGDTMWPPALIVQWIRKKYWPTVDVASVGPIAWRMAKRGQLGKDGPHYYRLDRDDLYRVSHENEAPTGIPEGASDAETEEGHASESLFYQHPALEGR